MMTVNILDMQNAVSKVKSLKTSFRACVPEILRNITADAFCVVGRVWHLTN